MTNENEGTLDNEENDFIPPKDGSWLPKVRVDEMVGISKDAAKKAEDALTIERQRTAELQSKLDSKPTETKTYTRGDLAQLVENETLTQVQADTVWDNQLETKFEKRLDQRLNESINASDINTKVNNDLNQYRAVIPDLDRPSENRTKVEDAYRYLLSIGQPNDVSTELAAVSNVFGPLEKLKQSKATLEMQTHQETGGGKSEPGKGKSFEDTLTARQKAHYEKGIDMGLYKNWDEVKEEMKYSK